MVGGTGGEGGLLSVCVSNDDRSLGRCVYVCKYSWVAAEAAKFLR